MLIAATVEHYMILAALGVAIIAGILYIVDR